MGLKVPTNNVLFPAESKKRIFGEECSLREIKCECGTLLFAILLEKLSEADVIWPFDVVCSGGEHRLVAKGTPGVAKLTCYGKFLDEYSAKQVLTDYESK